MMLHHCVTVGLVLGSYVTDELNIGLIVLFVHDASDIVLDLMKMANYLKVEDTHGFFVTEICFVSCVISWAYLRLYKFPCIIYYGVWLGIAEHCSHVVGSNNWEAVTNTNFAAPALILLSTLVVLHIYWFTLLIRIAIKLLTSKEGSNAAGKVVYEGASGSDICSDDDRKKR